MDSNYVDKSRLPSRHVTEGPERAPHRSYLYAMGLTSQQIHQPLIGVPIVNYDDNQHAANENLRLGNLWDGIETYAFLMADLHW